MEWNFSVLYRAENAGKCRTVSNRRQIIPRLTKETRVFDSNLHVRLSDQARLPLSREDRFVR